MRKRRPIELFSISFLDLLSGALGAVIILYVAIPKNKPEAVKVDDKAKQVLQKDLSASLKQIDSLKSQLQAAALQISSLEQIPVAPKETESKPEQSSGSGSELDIGFKFNGKNIVFIIDTSYSMTEEDRMGQVKAGLKMLLTSLSPQYSVEIIQYPYGTRAPFKALWGNLKNTNGLNKMDAFDFIYDMKPNGGTPTREALLHALRNYQNVSDIVLLSDGAPSLHNSNKKDDIYDIINLVREENKQKIQINTIGVGSNFIKDKTSEQYKFLSILSSQSGGFFVGF